MLVYDSLFQMAGKLREIPAGLRMEDPHRMTGYPRRGAHFVQIAGYAPNGSNQSSSAKPIHVSGLYVVSKEFFRRCCNHAPSHEHSVLGGDLGSCGYGCLYAGNIARQKHESLAAESHG